MSSNRRGFTLAEMLIAMVLLAVVIGTVLSMILSQSRYVSRVSGDVTTLDQVRASQEMLSYEVADLSRGSITFAGPDSIAYRLPIQWGVICGPIDRFTAQAPPAKKGSTTAVAPVYSTTVALQFEPDATALGTPAADGIATSLDGVTFKYYPVTNWSSLSITKDTMGAHYCLDAAPSPAKKKVKPGKKGAPPPPPATVIGDVDDYYVSPTLYTTLGGTPDERTLMYAFVEVSYYFKLDNSGGKVLYRNSKGLAQKLAWPFSPSAGFAYRLANATVSNTVSSANLANIRAVRVNLPAVRAQRGAMRADTLNVQPWVYLFNAR